MNRYEILLNKLPMGDLSVIRDRRTGQILHTEAERLLVLGNENSGKTDILLKDALQASKKENCRHLEYIAYDEDSLCNTRDSAPLELINNPCFFKSIWSSFQCRGLKSTATALYLDDILFYKDIDGETLSTKQVLEWASGLETVSRIVASCYIKEFGTLFGYTGKIIPSKIVIAAGHRSATWSIKVLG